MTSEPPKKQAKVLSEAYDFLKAFAAENEQDLLEDFLNSKNLSSFEDLSSIHVLVDMAKTVPSLKGEMMKIQERLLEEIRLINSMPIEDLLHRKRELLGQEFAGLPGHNVNEQVQEIGSLLTSRDGPSPAILVLGSSGSGKTTFAAMALKEKLKVHFSSDRIFGVYCTADVVRDELSRSSSNEQGGPPAESIAANALSREVRTIIRNEVDYFSDRNEPLKMHMVVIVDEVGLSLDEAWVGTKKKLDTLTTRLQDIATNVQLVLVGTGLDRITSSVNSNQDCVKIRMKPWRFEFVKWFAMNCLYSSNEEKTTIINTVSATPILRLLTTNARATRFLMQSLEKYVGYFDRNALIDHVVTDVAFLYIKSNRLKDLNTEQRRGVAKLVLKTVAESKNGITNQVFPTDLDAADGKIQSAVFSLIETHVENDKLIPNQQFAVSVSPAITIVLTALMGCISTLSSTWSDGFERIAALSELQRNFVASTEDRVPALIRTTLSFPPTKKNATKIKVPRLARPSVIVNGKGAAPYADVIGHKRLIQCKYKAVEGNKAKLNLKDELAKLGVLKAKHYSSTNDSDYRLNRFLTRSLQEQWKRMDSQEPHSERAVVDEERGQMTQATASSEGGIKKLFPDGGGGTRFMYPMIQLDHGEHQANEIEVDEYSHAGSVFQFQQNRVEWARELQEKSRLPFVLTRLDST